MEQTANSFDSVSKHSRVNWGECVRTQNLQAERSCISTPDVEYVNNPKAPLPSPAQLLDYDQACPGTADRIVSLLEQQVIHERALEAKKVAAEIARANRREMFAGSTRLVAVVGGFILLWYGKDLGAIAFIITFAEFVGTSVAGKIRQVRVNQKKIEQVMNAVALEMSPVDYTSKPDK